jgi:hypothetical protein
MISSFTTNPTEDYFVRKIIHHKDGSQHWYIYEFKSCSTSFFLSMKATNAKPTSSFIVKTLLVVTDI